MKKTLFSLAFVAASGVYVAAGNHSLPLPDEEPLGVAEQNAAPVDLAPARERPSSTLLASPEPAGSAAEPIFAEAAPLISPPIEIPATPATRQPTVAEIAPASTPPLPRPRPALPAVSIEHAASTNIAASTGSGYRDGTYTGSSENAYYGQVQVQVTVTNHVIAGIKVLDYPSDRRTSRYINSQALPILKQEVIAADSASIDAVSGATLTSEAYRRSLGNALSQAGATGA